MRFLSLVLLRLVARNIQSIVDFMTQLDARFDAFVAQKESELLHISVVQTARTETYLADMAKLSDRRNSILNDKALAESLKAALPKAPTA